MTTAPAPIKKRAKVTPKAWANAEAMWMSGEFTQSEIAKKLGVTEAAVNKHFDRKGIKKGARKEELLKAAEEEMKKTAVEEAALIALRIRETKEDHYKMASNLAKLTWAEILRVKSEGRELASIQGNLKTLESAMTVLKKAREERWVVLGLDKEAELDDDDIPDLVVSELTVEQIEAIRAQDSKIDDFSQFADVEGEADRDGDEDGVVEEGDDA